MKIHSKERPAAVGTILLTPALFVLFSCCSGELTFTVKPDEVATVVGKSFSYKLPAEMAKHSGYTFKVKRNKYSVKC